MKLQNITQDWNSHCEIDMKTYSERNNNNDRLAAFDPGQPG